MVRIVLIFASLWLAAAWTLPADASAITRAPTVHVIMIDKMAYGPTPTTVRAGDIIEWVNHGILEHSATARDGSFDIDLPPGATARMTATRGSVAFFCKFHPTMQGKLVVR